MRLSPFILVMVVLALSAAGQQNFTVDVQLPPSYSQLAPGDAILFNTQLLGNGGLSGNARFVREIVSSDDTVVVSDSVMMPATDVSPRVNTMRLPAGLPEGVYLLRVKAVWQNQTSDDTTSFTVVSKETPSRKALFASLFDVFVTIPKNYEVVAPGGELLANIKLTNLGSEGRVDVFLDYELLDSSDTIVEHNRETVAVETQANFVKTFEIPTTLQHGFYKFRATVTYADGKTATAEQTFEVEPSSQPVPIEIILISIAGILLLLVLAYKAVLFIQREKLVMQVHRIVKRRLGKRK